MQRKWIAVAGLAAVSIWGTATAIPRAEAAAAAPVPATRLLFDSKGVEAIDADGSNAHLLVADGGNADQTADGSRLVYVKTTTRTDDAGNQRWTSTLWLADGDGSGQHPLGGGALYGTSPRWSPDGTRVVFQNASADAGPGDNPSPTFAVVNADGTNPVTLGAGMEPDWSPDGQRLVFAANKRLWIMDARAGGTATAITPALEVMLDSELSPRWSPDGTLIAAGGSCISFVHPDGSGLRCLDGTSSGGQRSYTVGGWDPTSRFVSSTWGAFHDWGPMSWTDPATLQTHTTFGSGVAIPTAWAKATGPAPCRQGYWLLGRDGGVFSFGTAAFHGSTGGMRLNQPVVAMTSTPSGQGYWLVASDGGIFTFGDAAFLGSTGALRLKAPVVGMAATPTGQGYWLVASDGGIFTFGDAAFFGSMGGVTLAQPVVNMAATSSGRGYTLVARDAGMFTFGDAAFLGGLDPSDPVVAAAVSAGDGLLLATTTGEVAALGTARFCGSTRSLRLAAPIVGMARAA